MFHYLRAMLEDNDGATLIEYALLVSLIAVVCILSIKLVGTNTSNLLSSAAKSM